LATMTAVTVMYLNLFSDITYKGSLDLSGFTLKIARDRYSS